MKPSPKTRYTNTDRQRVLNFVQSLEISENQLPYVNAILEKSSFSSRDLRVLLEIVASKAKISSIQVETLGLPNFPNEVRQQVTA